MQHAARPEGGYGARETRSAGIAAIVIGGLLAVALAWFAQARITHLVAAETASRTVDLVEQQLLDHLAEADLAPSPTPARLADLARRLEPLVAQLRDSAGVLRLHVYARDGTVVYSDQADRRGRRAPLTSVPRLTGALSGSLNTRLLSLADESVPSGALSELQVDALDIFAPFVLDGRILGAYEVYRDPTPVRVARLLVWLAVVGGFAAVILWYVRARQSEQQRRLEQLARGAFYDPLTGLPNRALFHDRLGQAFRRAARRGEKLAVMFLDLDNFKAVNDSLGHGAGDQLLVAVGQRLDQSLRSEDTGARLAGDEFTVLLERVNTVEEASAVAERILAALRVPFVLDGQETYVGASIGLAMSRPDHRQPGDLLREADVALYRAKGAGKGRHALFDEDMDTSSIERRELEMDLRGATDRGELLLEYQPTFDVRTGALVGAEALLRWQHPRRGLILPAELIPLAEESGLIIPIGWWVIGEGCRQMRIWQAAHACEPPLTIGINVSPRQFQDPAFVEQLARALDQAGLAPGSLEIEITESALLEDVDATVSRLLDLRRLGVRLAIDDFGTGYSSLNYLRRFAVDTLKIDRSFVSELATDTKNRSAVRGTISLAHDLGLSVTAEGIESADELACLQALACDRAQGYYFAAPVSGEDFRAFLGAKSRAGERRVA